MAKLCKFDPGCNKVEFLLRPFVYKTTEWRWLLEVMYPSGIMTR